MAKNGAKGGGRKGAIRGRTQFLLPNGHYAKRDRKTGEILSVKADTRPYKGVVRETAQPEVTPWAEPQSPSRHLERESAGITGSASDVGPVAWGVRTR